MSQALLPFTPVGAVERVIRTFDFSAGLAIGETLTADSATCEITVISGSDDTPADRLISGPSITGALVTVLIGDMIDGVTYRVQADVATSGAQELSLWTTQKCVGP